MKDWEYIVREFEAIAHYDCAPKGMRMVHVGYIFDEDKSVKWNREQVDVNNEKYLAEVARLNTVKNKRRDAAINDALDIIVSDLDISKDKARLIWNYAYEHGHANGIYNIVVAAQELSAFVKELLA